jgi:recombinational DNA repair protein (RecF pathway)
MPKCDSCTQDLEAKIQVYPREGGILCEQCNWRIGTEAAKDAGIITSHAPQNRTPTQGRQSTVVRSQV